MKSAVAAFIIFTIIAATQAQTTTPGNGTTLAGGDATNGTISGKKKDPRLTGDPRKDYLYDPNLPRELNGFDLSYYPFYPLVPEDINFTCQDRHDGYYASIPHHCQLFHYCALGVRYDFLCANYTVFDQTQFICQFVSVVNCGNSEKFYDRNNDLYETTTTEEPRPRRRYKNRSKKRTTTPAPEYYDDEYYDYAEEEIVEEPTARPKSPPRQKSRPRTTETSPSETHVDPEIVEEPLPERQEAPQPVSRPKVRPPRPVKIRARGEASTTTEAPVVDAEYDYETITEEPLPKEAPKPVEEVQPSRRRPSSARGNPREPPAEEEVHASSNRRTSPKQAEHLAEDELEVTPIPVRRDEEKSAPAPPRRRITTTPAPEEHLVEEAEPVQPPRRRVSTPEKRTTTTTQVPEDQGPKEGQILHRPRPVSVGRPRINARPVIRPAQDEEEVVEKADSRSDVGSLEPLEASKGERRIQEETVTERPVKVRIVQRRRKTTTGKPTTTTVPEYTDYVE